VSPPLDKKELCVLISLQQFNDETSEHSKIYIGVKNLSFQYATRNMKCGLDTQTAQRERVMIDLLLYQLKKQKTIIVY
jgi:transcription termination factor Rho